MHVDHSNRYGASLVVQVLDRLECLVTGATDRQIKLLERILADGRLLFLSLRSKNLIYLIF